MFNINRVIKYNKKVSKNSGLTMIELMVVISIFLGISSTAIFNYGGFSSNVSLQNLTDDIALSIRKAQSFAIGARAVGDTFNNSYGMHFSVNPSPLYPSIDSSERSFLMFSVPITTPEKKFYTLKELSSCGDKSANNQCLEFFNIMTIDKIKKINAIKNSSVTTIIDSSTPNRSLDIVFTRPDPRAYICYRDNSNPSTNCESYSSVEIIISNGETEVDKEKLKMISVQNTGQISIQNYEE